MPRDPYSLPQAYQRWLYEDYAYLWRQQSAATRQICATAGSRLHLTGFQYWMKYNLTLLPDIAGMWHLDEKSGAICHDFSRNENHGTIIGASPTTGIIDGALSFDGINDYINFGDHSVFKPTQALTVELFYKQNALEATRLVSISGDDTKRGWMLRALNNTIHFILHDGLAYRGTISAALPIQTWHHIVAVYNRTDMRVYADGELSGAPQAETDPISYLAPSSLLLGTREDLPVVEFFDGSIDAFRIFDRAATPMEASRWSERRYPAQ